MWCLLCSPAAPGCWAQNSRSGPGLASEGQCCCPWSPGWSPAPQTDLSVPGKSSATRCSGTLEVTRKSWPGCYFWEGFSFSMLSPPSAPLPSPLNTAPEQHSGSSLISASCITPGAEVTTKFNLGPPSVLPDMLSLSLHQNEGQDYPDTFQCQAQQTIIFWCGLPCSDTLIVVPPTCLVHWQMQFLAQELGKVRAGPFPAPVG